MPLASAHVLANKGVAGWGGLVLPELKTPEEGLGLQKEQVPLIDGFSPNDLAVPLPSLNYHIGASAI